MIEEITNSIYQKYALFGWREIITTREAENTVCQTVESQSWKALKNESKQKEWRDNVITILDKCIHLSKAIELEENQPALKESLYKAKSRNALTLRKTQPIAPLDKDMQTKDQTLAYKVSRLMGSEDFESLTDDVKVIATPSDIEKIAIKYCKSKLPLDYLAFRHRLKQDDSSFWDELFRLVKRMAGITVSRMIELKWHRKKQLTELKEILENDSAVDTVELLYEKIKQDALNPSIADAVHFRNHLWRICLNKYQEAERRYIEDNTDYMEEHNTYNLSIDDAEETDFSKLIYDVDINSEYEVRLLLAYILLNPSHRWYSKLTKKEKAIDLFNAIYIQGMSYKQVVLEEFPQLPEKETEKMCAKYRKSVERIKERLSKRLYILIEYHNKEGYYDSEM